MKVTLKASILLNLVLLGGLAFVLVNQQQKKSAPALVLSEAKPPTQRAGPSAAAAPPDTEPFCWNQLVSAKDYRAYIANLRAIGCPEATIEDIVRGDAGRAFCWERNQLGLDGSGTGPWSRSREMQLIASLLGKQSDATGALAQGTANPMKENNAGEVAKISVPSQIVDAGAPSYPLFLQDVNWRDLDFNANQQATIAQVRQQFLTQLNEPSQDSSGTGSAGQNPNSATPGAGQPNSNPDDPAFLPRWQKALQDANNRLRDLLGGQGYMAYEQAQYNAWFGAQQDAANAQGVQLAINPAAFLLK